MMETEMGYRGSKSNISNIVFVKEQRVDGSCIGTPSLARTDPDPLSGCARPTLLGQNPNSNVKVYSGGFLKKLSSQNHM